jgi:hypothetical protein
MEKSREGWYKIILIRDENDLDVFCNLLNSVQN